MSEEISESRRSILMQRLRENGAGGFSKQELLELLLLYSVRRKDTDEVTARLFDYFGSMTEVLEAPVMELTNIEGVSKNSAVLLSMIPQVARRMQMDSGLRKNIKGLQEIREFVPNCFIGKTVEHFLLLCLDRNEKLIHYEFVSIGTVNFSTVNLRKLIHIVLSTKATYAVIAHNHPRGVTYPSKDDIKTTRSIAKALHSIDVKLLEHLIVNSQGTFSIASAPKDIRQCLNPA